jgi:hypothetical protein
MRLRGVGRGEQPLLDGIGRVLRRFLIAAQTRNATPLDLGEHRIDHIAPAPAQHFQQAGAGQVVVEEQPPLSARPARLGDQPVGGLELVALGAELAQLHAGDELLARCWHHRSCGLMMACGAAKRQRNGCS